MEKMTNLIAMNYVIDTFGAEMPADVFEKMTNMQKSLVKKSATRSKADKAKAELNEKIADMLVDALAEAEKPMTVTELQKSTDDLSEYTNQKLTAVLKMMISDGRVEKSVAEKPKRTVFSLV